jgi:hypothetical protein
MDDDDIERMTRTPFDLKRLFELHDAVEEDDYDPTFVPSHNKCNICGTKGLHWSKENGKHRLRTEQGLLHVCNRHGVTINLSL